MEGNYYQKYIKYKNKYIKLHKYMHGGTLDLFKDELYGFFIKHFDLFLRSELRRIFIPKYFDSRFYTIIENDEKVINPETLPQMAGDIMPIFSKTYDLIFADLVKLCEFLYSRLQTQENEIVIFSYSTGNGFFEAVFGLYLKIVKNKAKVNIVCHDPFTEISIIKAYGVFTEAIGILQNIGYDNFHLFTARLNTYIDKMRTGQPIPDKLKQAVNNMLENKINKIDIFIAMNAGIISYKDIHGQTYDTVMIATQYVTILTKTIEALQKIPMFWLYCDYRLDFNSNDSLTKSIYEINRKYFVGEGHVLASLSSLDNLWLITGLDKGLPD